MPFKTQLEVQAVYKQAEPFPVFTTASGERKQRNTF